MMILLAFMLSNHTWTFWIQSQGLVLHPARSMYCPKSQQLALQHPLQGIFGPLRQEETFSLLSSLQSNTTEQSMNALHLDLDGIGSLRYSR
jgi:hypothetical protein